LSNVERSAFREIARALGARFDDDARSGVEAAPGPSERRQPARAVPAGGNAPAAMLDRLPVGVLIHRGGHILFANRSLLDLAGYEDIAALRDSGGFPRLFPGSPTLVDSEETGQRLPLSTRAAGSCLVDVRSGPVDWDGAPASLVMLQPLPDGDSGERLRRTEAELRERDQRVHELEAILDTATDGVIVVDETGRILSLNRSAEALFGYDQREVVGDAITVLLAPESHIVALDYLEGLRAPGVASLLNDGRDVMGRVRQGGSIPLFMTMGHVGEGPNRKFCAVLRDVTAFKKAEGELLSAKRAAEEASAQKSDLLAKISHEIRTPLNAIIGFAEVMLEERFGPVGNERYKDYLKDVHASGAHVISLVNDLLDLAKIEAGRMELAFTSVSLNELVSSCVALLQPQAARERIVMRTSFASKLPPVVADERSMRQIVLNLVSNAIKFTDAGGQVIVSTAVTDRGEVAFRVRDTGIGMTEAEVEAALEPFRQLATARKRGGTGLGLPLTKALVEANRGALQISSHPNEGTLVEVLFPPTRVLAG
jgi:PAS domain S-box-containing protein